MNEAAQVTITPHSGPPMWAAVWRRAEEAPSELGILEAASCDEPVWGFVTAWAHVMSNGTMRTVPLPSARTINDLGATDFFIMISLSQEGLLAGLKRYVDSEVLQLSVAAMRDAGGED